MNVNIKLSLTDIDRNLIADRVDGKNTKRLATRKDINKLVEGFIEGFCEESYTEGLDAEVENRPMQEFDQSKVPAKHLNKPIEWQMGWYRGRYLTRPSVR